MGAKTAVSVEDYLHMTFDGPDREYLDGEIVERNMGDPSHSAIQARLIQIFYDLQKKYSLFARPELRHRVTPTRYRIPDVAIYTGKPPKGRIPPDTAPLIAIEVISPDDRYSSMLAKLQEYQAWGVAHIWVIDPRTRQLSVFSSQGLKEVPALPVPEYSITLTAEEIFSELD